MTNMRTRIIVHSKDPVYLRGEGTSSLNWEKGIPLQQASAEEWIWETDETFVERQYKLLLYDQTSELGDSHPLYPGASILVNPRFPS